VTRQAPAAMADEAVAMVDTHGFRTLKIKGGQGLAVDVQGIAEIRRALHDGVALYVDANGAYSLEQAADYARAVADAGAVVIEDPCPLSPGADFVKLSNSIPIPLLVDFGCWSLRDAGLFLEIGAQALSVKPGRFGLSDSRLMQDLATKAGCGVVAGLMGESTLGTFAALHFAAALEKPLLPAELTWFLAMTERITTLSPTIADGMVEMPQASSLASIVDWSAVRRYSV
jgi:L-alanine-DL-glutamate epimerase-like enolase superfamily enzyme